MLKEYKELIAVIGGVLTIIAIVLGGFIWLDNQFDRFPSKKDLKAEVARLDCLLTKYMTLTQLQIRDHDLEKQLDKLDEQKRGMETGPTLTPAMQAELDEITTERSHVWEEHQLRLKEMSSITDELARNVCTRGGP